VPRTVSKNNLEDRGMHAASIIRLCTVTAGVAVLVLGAGNPARAAVPLPNGAVIQNVDFERHIVGLFGRMGCNAGSCHGSFQGKGGFRLSLFGYDPDKDYAALTRDSLGRRLDRVEPDRSLLLLKATGQTEHGGGRRFGIGSWQYQVLREWIEAGCPQQKGSGDILAVKITPPELAFRKPKEVGQLRVVAQFAGSDGRPAEEDITPFCDFRTNDDAVAEVNALGQVTALRAGDTAVVVSYRGQVVPVRVLVPLEMQPGFVYPQLPEVNYIDHEVYAKLRRLNILPSPLAPDNEFLRRLYIDTIGSLPSPDEVRAFLADTDPDKRTKLIDKLLAHPLHAAVWATKFSDITGNNTDALENPQQIRPKLSQMWHDWLRKRLADNMPYDEIVRGILCATSRDGLSPEAWLKQQQAIDEEAAKGFNNAAYVERPTLDLFWRRQQPVTPDQWGEKTAAAFLGVRLECAQCHKHPFDRWTQVEYRAYANIFAPVTFGASPEAAGAIKAANAAATPKGATKNQNRPLREVFIASSARLTFTHPDTNKPLTPRALGGPEIKPEKDRDPRVALFEWMRRPDNPFFARAFVNRVWGHYFGVGIVDPVDNFSLANPPSNDKLLDALAKDFIDHKFDIRYLERTVLLSRTYQQSSVSNPTNRLDRNNYSHSYARPMMAEVVVDVLNSALSATEAFGPEAPANVRAVEVGSSRIQNATVGYAMRIFGKPPRTTACDCERAMEPALPQKLFLMSNPIIQGKITKGRVQELVRSKKTDEECLDEIFLAALSRLPNDNEKRVFSDYKANSKDRLALLTDTMWAVINTREFILNH
jgi:hypothetical protein